jgi:hypothetical protein
MGLRSVDDDINWATTLGPGAVDPATGAVGHPNLPTAGFTYPTAGQVVYATGQAGTVHQSIAQFENKSISSNLTVLIVAAVVLTVLIGLKGGR